MSPGGCDLIDRSGLPVGCEASLRGWLTDTAEEWIKMDSSCTGFLRLHYTREGFCRWLRRHYGGSRNEVFVSDQHRTLQWTVKSFCVGRQWEQLISLIPTAAALKNTKLGKLLNDWQEEGDAEKIYHHCVESSHGPFPGTEHFLQSPLQWIPLITNDLDPFVFIHYIFISQVPLW